MKDTLMNILNTVNLIMKRVNNDVYFLICDNAIQADMVINIYTNNCKFRMLKDSPDNIRYVMVMLEIL
jgi:hypothetical protein